MIKLVNAVTMGLSSDAAALNAANLVAQRCAAHIRALHVRPNALEISMIAGGCDFGVETISPDLWDTLERDAKGRADKARHHFETFCTDSKVTRSTAPSSTPPVTAEWLDVEGSRNTRIVEYARLGDLTVIARSTEPFGFMPDDLGDILVLSGRPLLLVPRHVSKSVGDTIVVAWKQTAEAARAVGAAMPLLCTAGRVIIMTASEDSPETAVDGANALSSYLRWHGVSANVQHLVPGDEGAPAAMLKAADERGADLVVMGGYGHSRLREFVFGGFTHYVLFDAKLPVLLMH